MSTVQTVAVWFSAMLKVAVSVDGEVSSIWRTVVVFQAAEDWDAARLKAVGLGRAKNETYANGDGRAVAHQFIEVETLDMLGEQIDDGRDVYFEHAEYDGSQIPTRDPSDIRPGQTGV